ncbi:UNKNOWN [Stylonychia lemnae]|uniref:FUN14 family protein n=1 Tax=Stylonychia lemnae TaxID=5949 RepID=A0A078B1R6_STYLE|nr:UNKNOWN [Stylonychia lemnae]|eukprot:CDW87223.1 UNKNOWN [Stylonychia lemnae]
MQHDEELKKCYTNDLEKSQKLQLLHHIKVEDQQTTKDDSYQDYNLDKIGITTSQQKANLQKIIQAISYFENYSEETKQALESIFNRMGMSQRGLNANEIEQNVQKQLQTYLPYYAGMPLRTLFGTAMGYCMGLYIKQVSQKIAIYSGLCILGLSILSKLRYISINWGKIDSDVHYLVFQTAEQQKSIINYIKRLLTHVLPLCSGLGAGFYYAFKKS